jgi:hypothetical protein
MRLLSTVFALCTVVPMVAHAQATAENTVGPAPSTAPAEERMPPMASPAAPAAEAAAPAPAPAAPPVTFGWEALVDSYYMYNFTGDPKTQGPNFRQFDNQANSFTLNYAKLGVHAETDLVSFRMDLGAGHTAALIGGGDFLVQQAYATVKLDPKWCLDVGRFVTSASAEVIESNKNWLYSRSLLFYGVPLLHTGARLNVTPLGTMAAPELLLSFQIVNGWNNDPDTNSDKTFGFNATYTPANQGLTASFTTYIGKEVAGADTRMLFDGVVLKDIGNLSVGLNIDYVKEGPTNWFGVSAMGRYILSDSFYVAARGEFVKNKNTSMFALPAADPTAPALAFDGSLYEFTGLGAWTVGKHYELRAELRADMSDKDVFAKGTTARKNQVTGLLAALAYF